MKTRASEEYFGVMSWTATQAASAASKVGMMMKRRLRHSATPSAGRSRSEFVGSPADGRLAITSRKSRSAELFVEDDTTPIDVLLPTNLPSNGIRMLRLRSIKVDIRLSSPRCKHRDVLLTAGVPTSTYVFAGKFM